MKTEKPCGKDLSGEMDALGATISGEIKPDEIPLAAGVDMDLLKSYDDDPLEVVVEIPASVSTRGWEYTAKAIEDIVKVTQEKTLPGILGHQKSENVSSEFVPPVTHWVGAEMKGEKGYFRGLVDKAATDLKRWIRTGRIREVSIYGFPTLETKNGKTKVVGYEPLSIDWTPLHRPGMSTKIVGMEMDTTDELRDALCKALKERFEDFFVQDVFYRECAVIVEVNDKLFRVHYEETGDKVKLTDQKEVKREIRYVPIEEGEKRMSIDEMKKMIESEIEKGSFTLDDMREAIGKPSGEMDSLKEKLGLSGEMDMEAYLKEAVEAKAAKERADHEAMIREAVQKKVSGELNQNLILEMMKNSDAKTDEEACGEIDGLLENKAVKAIIDRTNVESGAGVGGKSTTENVVRTKRTRI